MALHERGHARYGGRAAALPWAFDGNFALAISIMIFSGRFLVTAIHFLMNALAARFGLCGVDQICAVAHTYVSSRAHRY
jgi:hypothetical protein